MRHLRRSALTAVARDSRFALRDKQPTRRDDCRLPARGLCALPLRGKGSSAHVAPADHSSQAKPTARPLAPLWRLELVMGECQRTLWRRWTSEGGASRLAPPPVWVLRRGAAAWAHAPDERGRTEDERGEQARLGDRGETPAVGVVIG